MMRTLHLVPLWAIVFQGVLLFAFMMAWAWAEIRRARGREANENRETALAAENERLQREIENLSFNPLTERRSEIFRHIREFTGE